MQWRWEVGWRWLGVVLLFWGLPAVVLAQCLPDTVQWQRWTETVRPLMRQAPARVEPLEATEVASEVAGRLVQLPVRVGERVAAGALLAEIDATPWQLAHREAEAAYRTAQVRLTQAQRLLAQTERLVRERASHEEAVRAAHEAVLLAQAEVELRAAQLAQAKWRLAQTVVRAPFAGIVTARRVSVGNMVAAGQPLVTLVPTVSEVAVRLPLGQAAELRDQGAAPYWVTNGAASVPLIWVAESGAVDAAAQLLSVRLRAAGQAPLIPGQVGVVRWQAPQAVVPAEVVAVHNGQLGVWLRQAQEQPRFVPLPNALPGRAAAVALPEGWSAAETEIAVSGQGALAWSDVRNSWTEGCR